MKKRTENLLVAALAAASTGTAAVYSDNKAVKFIASGLALACGGYLIFRNGKQILKDTVDEVNKECDETEREIEASGINPEILESNSLDNHEDENKSGINIKALFRQSREIFSDEELVSHTMNEHVLHVLSRGKKLVFAIQMPKSRVSRSRTLTRKEIGSFSLSSKDMYLYFKDSFLDYAKEDSIGINSGINIYQKGMAHVTCNNYWCYEPIEKLEGEETPEYIKRINSIVETWGGLESFRQERINEYKSEGKTLHGYEIFMFIEFPIQREGDPLPGMTVTKTMWLIRELMDTYFEINNSKTGIDSGFEFNHVLFHPGEDLFETYCWNDEEKTIEIYKQ